MASKRRKKSKKRGRRDRDKARGTDAPWFGLFEPDAVLPDPRQKRGRPVYVPSPTGTSGSAPLVVPTLPGGGAPSADAAAGAHVAPLGMARNKYGLPISVTPTVATRIKCPSGYVAVSIPQADGTTARACMLRGPAIAAGLWKPRKKGPISPAEWTAIKRIDRVQTRLKKMGRVAGLKPVVSRKK